MAVAEADSETAPEAPPPFQTEGSAEYDPEQLNEISYVRSKMLTFYDKIEELSEDLDVTRQVLAQITAERDALVAIKDKIFADRDALVALEQTLREIINQD